MQGQTVGYKDLGFEPRPGVLPVCFSAFSWCINENIVLWEGLESGFRDEHWLLDIQVDLGFEPRPITLQSSAPSCYPIIETGWAIGSQNHGDEKGPRFAVCKLGTEGSKRLVSFSLSSESKGQRRWAVDRSTCKKAGVVHRVVDRSCGAIWQSVSLLMGVGNKGNVKSQGRKAGSQRTPGSLEGTSKPLVRY